MMEETTVKVYVNLHQRLKNKAHKRMTIVRLSPLTWLAYNLALSAGFGVIYGILRMAYGQNNEPSKWR